MLLIIEAEYIALMETATENYWLCGLLALLEFPQPEPMPITEDNHACISLAKNDCYHQKAKHIDIKYHFICECINNGELIPIQTPTNEQPADMLTKPLSQDKLQSCMTRIGQLSVQQVGVL